MFTDYAMLSRQATELMANSLTWTRQAIVSRLPRIGLYHFSEPSF